ncbi:hypothetical protein [Catellatospora tritici]|uniref:hypothetical protein n=1 Tax=Catellatospora tritici TaxID=2851566 RepID=UPI001C2D4117|nr:hypothetical protein [Catellatospora tritici]MBV1850800.1 hypothetical protein [Catellatospora tritici]MBV1851053.1 hypothetical protein [Catellatospora tritici]
MQLLTGRPWWWLAGATGLALGLVAFGVDEIPQPGDRFAEMLFSTTFVWGAAALVCGYLSHDALRAVATATGALALATVSYYLLVLLVSRRWAGGMLEDGSSADLYGIMSIGRATVVWLAVAAVVGPVMGWLGHLVAGGSRRTGALAAGVAFGALAAESAHLLWTYPMWLTVGREYQVQYAIAALGLCLAVLTTVVLLRRRPGGVAWPLFLVCAVVTLVGAVLAWQVLEAWRNVGFEALDAPVPRLLGR